MLDLQIAEALYMPSMIKALNGLGSKVPQFYCSKSENLRNSKIHVGGDKQRIQFVPHKIGQHSLVQMHAVGAPPQSLLLRFNTQTSWNHTFIVVPHVEEVIVAYLHLLVQLVVSQTLELTSGCYSHSVAKGMNGVTSYSVAVAVQE